MRGTFSSAVVGVASAALLAGSLSAGLVTPAAASAAGSHNGAVAGGAAAGGAAMAGAAAGGVPSSLSSSIRGAGRIAGRVALAGGAGLGSASGSVCVTARMTSPAVPVSDGLSAASGSRATQSVRVSTRSGEFLLAGLAAGDWVVAFKRCGNAVNFQPVVYHQGQQVKVVGSETSSIGTTSITPEIKLTGTGYSSLQALAARGGQFHALVTAAGSGNGSFSGEVTDESGHPLKGICVEAFQYSTGEGGGKAITRANGTYKISVPAGTWAVGFAAGCGNKGNYIAAFYGGSINPPGEPVHVRAGKNHAGVNQALVLGGEIEGAVKSDNGKLLHPALAEGVMVIGNNIYIWLHLTRSGKYAIQSMPTGNWKMAFSAEGNWVSQWYNRKNTQGSAKVLHLGSGTILRGIDSALRPGAILDGQVVSSPGQPLSGICVYVGSAFAIQLGIADETSTDAAGDWSVDGFDTGTQHVAYVPGCGSSGDWAADYTAGKAHLVAGTTTTLPAFTMPPGGEVTGTVTDGDGNPLVGVCVGTGVGLAGPYAVTGADGTYVVHNVAPGHTPVGFVPNCGYAADRNLLEQWWPNQDNASSAENVTVTAGEATSGINATLQPGGVITGTVYGLDKVQLGMLALTLIADPGPVGFGETTGASASLGAAAAIPDSSLSLAARGVSTNLAGEAGAVVATPAGFEGIGIPSGTYELLAGLLGPGADIPVLFHGGPGSAARAAMTALSVTAGSTTAGANLDFPPVGQLRGTASFPSHMQQDAICVQLFSGGTGALLTVPVAHNGSFVVDGISAGDYTAMFGSCDATSDIAPSTFETSIVGGATTTVRVNLTVGSSISGRVDANGPPFGHGCVLANLPSGSAAIVETDKKGAYKIVGLAAGTYTVVAEACVPSKLGDEVYPSPLTIGRDQAISGLDFDLTRGGEVSGTITGPGDVGIGGLCIDVYSPAAGVGYFAVTASDGTYTAENLGTGQYFVATTPDCGSDYLWVPEFLGGTLTPTEASYVSVTAGQETRGANIVEERDGSITGTVSDTGDQPLTGVCVVAVPKVWTGYAPILASTTDGSFTISGLAPSSYQVGYESGCGASGYATQWYDNSPTQSGSTPVKVAAGSATTGIDASLTSG